MLTGHGRTERTEKMTVTTKAVILQKSRENGREPIDQEEERFMTEGYNKAGRRDQKRRARDKVDFLQRVSSTTESSLDAELTASKHWKRNRQILIPNW